MASATIGYARTSTAEQVAGLDAQVRDLKVAGAERVFTEQVSGSTMARAQLEEAITWARDGDTLIVCKPDRLARSTVDLLAIVARLEAKGIGLVILSMGGSPLDTRSPTGKLMLTMLAAVAEFEKALMLERQREGIAKARGEGRYKGRAPTARNQSAEVLRLRADGMTPTQVAKLLGMSRMSVYRIIQSGDGRERVAI